MIDPRDVSEASADAPRATQHNYGGVRVSLLARKAWWHSGGWFAAAAGRARGVLSSVVAGLRARREKISHGWVRNNFAPNDSRAANLDDNYLGDDEFPKPPASFDWMAAGWQRALATKELLNWRLLLLPATILVLTSLWFGYAHAPVVSSVSFQIQPTSMATIGG